MSVIVTRAGKGSPLSWSEGDANFTNLNNDKVEEVNPSTSGTLTHSGDVVLSGTGKRITGDFSNATIANRVMFQNSVVNTDTTLGILPNGSGVTANFAAYSNSADPSNSSVMFFGVSGGGTEVRLQSAAAGTGTYLPMTFHTGGTERLRIGTAGQIGFSGANYGTTGQVIISGGPSTAPSWGTVSGVPTGTVIHTAASDAPSGFIKANGALVSRTTYAALFAVIGTTYGAGDGSTTFGIPDLRGEFLRGLDDGRGVDSGRALGSSQSWAIENITGRANSDLVRFNLGATDGAFAAESMVSRQRPSSTTTGDTYGINFDASRVVRTANETRPRNVALLACIKF